MRKGFIVRELIRNPNRPEGQIRVRRIEEAKGRGAVTPRGSQRSSFTCRTVSSLNVIVPPVLDSLIP